MLQNLICSHSILVYTTIFIGFFGYYLKLVFLSCFLKKKLLSNCEEIPSSSLVLDEIMSYLETLHFLSVPAVAQLVERRIVEAQLISLGRRFESDSKESFLLSLTDSSYATNCKLFYSIFVYITKLHLFCCCLS